ncbi:CHAT domain-containing protein [[Phormidium] sp. ETS-05]|uniref:CHAT domain-containing protein n=1 Tax=[Phormidium] sp. ETS-05 TaxID=222819 RepID=UPI0018EEF871|nr:CHAT domain-containing protein [[Phormidium] sp. ETS-05]
MLNKGTAFYHRLMSGLRRQARFIIICICGLLASLGIQLLSPNPADSTVRFPDADLTAMMLAEEITSATPNGINEGVTLYQNGRFAEAAAAWQRALELPLETEAIALTWNYLSLAHQQLGNWQEAEEAINKSLQILESLPDGDKKSQVLARSISTQGRLEMSQGKLSEGLEKLEKATEIYEEIGDTEGVIGSQLNQAQILRYLGRYRDSLKMLMPLEENIDKQPDSQKAISYLSLGNTLFSIGDFEQSWCYLQKGLATDISMSNSMVESSLNLSMGNTAWAIFQREKDLKNQTNTDKNIDDLVICQNEDVPRINAIAKEFEGKAKTYYAEVVANSYAPTTRLEAKLNWLRLLGKDERKSEINNSWQQIEEDLAALSPSRGGVYARINLAMMMNEVGDRTRAKQLLQQAIDEAQTLDDRRSLSYAIGYMGHIQESEDQSQAIQLTQKALNLAKDAPDIAYQWDWQLGRILKAEGKQTEAITHYTKAVNTLQTLRLGLVSINFDFPEINADLQFTFRERVEPVYRELVDLLLPAAESHPSQENLKEALEVMEALQIAELETFLQCSLPRLEEPEKIEEILEKFDNTKAVLIYTIVLADRIALIVKQPNHALEYYSVMFPENQENRQEMADFIEVFSDSIQQGVGQGHLLGSKIFYDLLIQPLSNLQTSQTTTLVFVLDDILRPIPMAALSDGTQYLIEKYPLAVALGLRQIDFNPWPQRGLEVLAAGFEGRSPSFDKVRVPLAPIGKVGDLLDTIQKSIRGKKIINTSFSKDNLESEMNLFPFPVIHMTTHGQFSSNPQDTFVLAWDEPIRVKELDELLRSNQRASAEAIELLVLSACETAKGDKRAALGLAGVAVQAGARSTVATLWKVTEDSTVELLEKFYEELAKKEETKATKAEVLREAQLALLRGRNEEYKHPRYWSPFIVVGNWQ